MQALRIALAQIDSLVGDVSGNVDRIIRFMTEARDVHGADLVVFPELTLTGYPPEDLLMRPGLHRKVAQEFERLKQAVNGIDMLVGYPELAGEFCFNSAALIRQGEVVANYRKQTLPNYGVFDEKRYFEAGEAATVVEVAGARIGITLCEDIWVEGPAWLAAAAGAEIIVNLNASPFHVGKMQLREDTVQARVEEVGLPVVYVNLVGGQDELVFDGASFVLDAEGQVSQRLRPFVEQLAVVEFENTEEGWQPRRGDIVSHPGEEEAVYQALVLGVRDYVRKNGFEGVLLGLSGGIDSALTLAVAVDALGAENVETLMLPSRYTADMSQEDATKMAEGLGVQHLTLAIEPAFKSFREILAPAFTGLPMDVTEENIQARCRCVILMAVSNKSGRMLLTTGNKSEMSVGYCTLYGDMAGGYCVLKDVPKLLVYRLAEYVNREREIIPRRIIERPPSAELAPDQTDQDSLPPYEVLDAVLERYVERDMPVEDIIAEGYAAEVVLRVARLVDQNEYKRRQAAPGVRITPRAFGKDRRYPISSGYRETA